MCKISYHFFDFCADYSNSDFLSVYFLNTKIAGLLWDSRLLVVKSQRLYSCFSVVLEDTAKKWMYLWLATHSLVSYLGVTFNPRRLHTDRWGETSRMQSCLPLDPLYSDWVDPWNLFLFTPPPGRPIQYLQLFSFGSWNNKG